MSSFDNEGFCNSGVKYDSLSVSGKMSNVDVCQMIIQDY